MARHDQRYKLQVGICEIASCEAGHCPPLHSFARPFVEIAQWGQLSGAVCKCTKTGLQHCGILCKAAM